MSHALRSGLMVGLGRLDR